LSCANVVTNEQYADRNISICTVYLKHKLFQLYLTTEDISDNCGQNSKFLNLNNRRSWVVNFTLWLIDLWENSPQLSLGRRPN